MERGTKTDTFASFDTVQLPTRSTVEATDRPSKLATAFARVITFYKEKQLIGNKFIIRQSKMRHIVCSNRRAQ